MFYDLTDTQQKAELGDWVSHILTDAETEHATMHGEWNEADDYYENDQVPPGFSEAHAQHASDANDVSVDTTQNAKQYIVVNKVKETHEAVLGDFINGKRVISVSANTPRDTKRAKALRAAIEEAQRRTKLWEQVMIPTIDAAIRRGQHYVKIWFNPNENVPYGKIEVRQISTRDILLDPDSRDFFYDDTKYRIHRMRFEVTEANKKFRQLLDVIGDGTDLSPDNDADVAYQKTPRGTTQNYCTVYEIEYTQLETSYLLHDKKSDKLQEIDEETFQQLSQNPQTANTVFTQDTKVWYTAFYNKAIGLFYNDRSDLQMWGIIPCLNIRSEGRCYCFGDTMYYKNLQDLFNVLLSVTLENAKAANRLILGMDPHSFELYGAIAEQALKTPGNKIIPAQDLKQIKVETVNAAVVQLIQMTEQFMYGIQSKHAASRGEQPSPQTPAKGLEFMIRQDRQSHGRKDVMINWTLTEIGKVMYQIIKDKYTDEFWVKLTDAQPDNPQFIPINFVLNEQEYMALLEQMNGLNRQALKGPRSSSPEDMTAFQAEAVAFQQALAKAKKEFEQDNDVKSRKVKVYEIPGNEGQFTGDQLSEMLTASGMEPEEFQQKYNPQEVEQTIYVINDLTSDMDVDVKLGVDFDFENDKQFRQQLAFALFDRHAYTTERLLKAIEEPDAEAIAKEAEEQNQLLQLGKQIVANPQLFQQVQAVLQGMPGGKPQPAEVG